MPVAPHSGQIGFSVAPPIKGIIHGLSAYRALAEVKHFRERTLFVTVLDGSERHILSVETVIKKEMREAGMNKRRPCFALDFGAALRSVGASMPDPMGRSHCQLVQECASRIALSPSLEC